MPTNDDLLFAEHALKLGFVSRDEIEASLSVQRRMEDMGVKDSLRNVMVNRSALREGDAALVAKSANLAPGRDPIPGFTLESRLGTGAMGSVYKAFQRGMQRHVAVKILRRDLTSDPRQVERLRREAALVGKLNHPNIVRGLDSGETNGLVWFAMEYVDGMTLRERIHAAGRLPLDEAIAVTRQMAEALEHADEQGIVHRDIKPGNILLTKQGLPRLADYGLAKGQTDDALTQIDATLGTPQYVAPEQARNPRDADIRSDVYSLGATLYTMLSGRPPFEGETLAQTLTKVLYERPKPIRELVPDLPEPIVYLVERMMAKDRRYRYPSPAALLHDLRAFERGNLRVPLGFTGDIEVFEEKRRRGRLWAVGAAIVAAAAGLGAAGLWWEGESRARDRERQARQLLQDARAAPGAEPDWDGPTVADMNRRFERLRDEFFGTAAADEASADLAAWRRQEQALKGVQELARRADGADIDWPRLVAELEDRQRSLATEPDAGVARRQLAVTLRELRDRRDRKARGEVAALKGDESLATLADAARAWDALADTLRTRYYRGERHPAIVEAEALAPRFLFAARALDAAFAPWDQAARDGALDRGEFLESYQALQSVEEALRADAALREALAELPPAGRWPSLVVARRAAAATRLADAARRGLEALRSEVDRLRARKAFADAIERIDAFDPRALPDQADDVAEVRARVEDERAAEVAGAKDATAKAALLYFNAFGRLDTAGAEQVLTGLERTLAQAAVRDAAGDRFLVAARRLLETTEAQVWERFRAGAQQHVQSGGGLADRRGIQYRDIRSISVGRPDVLFTYGGGQIWQGTLSDLALDDVFAAGQVPLGEPGAALAVAALRITQYHASQFKDTRELRAGLRLLDGVAPLLVAAQGVAGAAPVVDWLSMSRAEKIATTQAEIAADEEKARTLHQSAAEDIEAARPDAALLKLHALLGDRSDRRLKQTDYVASRKDEIRRQIEQAGRARQASSFAERFRWARFTDQPDNGGTIFCDFEDPALQSPEMRASLGLADGGIEIGSRLLVVSDRPGPADAGDGAPAVRLGHVLEWLDPAPGDGEARPWDLPQLRIDCPFQPRRRIEVSFLCRAERPFFLAVSVCGVAAGVLSASDSLQGGRGVLLWNAADLDRPDKEFDREFNEKGRTGFLEAQPAALKKEGDTRYFQFEPGRVHRVRVVKGERSSQLWVDGRLRTESDVRFQPGPLQDKVVLMTYGTLYVDDLRIAGTLDPEWLKRR